LVVYLFSALRWLRGVNHCCLISCTENKKLNYRWQTAQRV